MWFLLQISLQELKTVKLRVPERMPSMLLKDLIYSLEKIWIHLLVYLYYPSNPNPFETSQNIYVFILTTFCELQSAIISILQEAQVIEVCFKASNWKSLQIAG